MLTAIHAIDLLNVAYKIIVPFVHVQLAISEIHSTVAIWNQYDNHRNVPAIANVQHLKPASIDCVKIHALNEIHVSKMPNAVPYSTIQRVIVPLVGLAIHKFNAIDVSCHYIYPIVQSFSLQFIQKKIH